MKNLITKNLFGFILGIIICSGIVYAANYYATDISYKPTDASWEVNNVNDALNDLYDTLNGKKTVYVGSYSNNQNIDINALNIVDNPSVLTADNFLVVVTSYHCASEGNNDGSGASYTKYISKNYSNGILQITGAYANSLNDHGYNSYSYSIVTINYDIYLITE